MKKKRHKFYIRTHAECTIVAKICYLQILFIEDLSIFKFVGEVLHFIVFSISFIAIYCKI